MLKRLNAVALLILVVYFGYFASGAIQAHFATDDPTNLGYYWRRGLGRVLLDNLRFWSTAYRPMGGLFYLPIYYPFHLNPLPYRIVVLAILAANVALTWFLADKLTESKAAAALAAMLVCAHAAMLSIYYNTSMIYDILAFFFTAVLLAIYVGIRSTGRELRLLQILLVMLAYIAAIDSKEMAVVAAGWVLAYEVLIPKTRQWAASVALLIVGLVYTGGKMFGPNSLSKVEGYTLEFTLHRYFVNNEAYWNSLFYSRYFHTSRRLLIAWVVLTVVCALLRRRELWWCWFLISTATLATSFTVVSREGGALYLPLLAWALLVSVMVARAIPRPSIRWTALAIIALLWSHETIRQWRAVAPAYLGLQDKTWSVIIQIRDLPRPVPGSRVMILNSPFDGWDALFISELLWNDRSIDIHMGDKSPSRPSPEELKSYDLVLAFDRDHLRVAGRR